MARHPRYILPGHLYEITLTTFQSRFFFIPSKRLNELIIGALAYAQRKYSLDICFVVLLSNHGHLLVRADSAEQVSGFLCLAKSQIAKEVQRLCGWTGGIFEPHSDITVVTPEPQAQKARLRYVMSQGLKEGLVPHPSRWPGVHSATALMTGSMRLQGVWVRRSELWERTRSHSRRLKAVRRIWHKKPDYKKFEDRIALELSPLPCWDHLDDKEVAKRSRELCQSLLEEYSEVRASVEKGYRKRLMDRSMFCRRPEVRRKTNRPKVHADAVEEWVRYVETWKHWLGRYEHASSRLRQGILEAVLEFPEHAFLPTGILFRMKSGVPPPAST